MRKQFAILAGLFLIVSACGGNEPSKEETSPPVKKEALQEQGVEEAPAPALETVPPEKETSSAMEKPKALKKCLPCHSFEEGGKKKSGPNLFGIYGAEAGRSGGFTYSSDFMKAFKGKKWDDAMIDAWIKDPKAVAGKTKMITKISDPVERAQIIEYLKTLK